MPFQIGMHYSVFLLFLSMNSFSRRWKEKSEDWIVVEPFFELRDEFFRILEILLKRLWNFVEISSGFNKIKKKDCNENRQQDRPNSGDKKENIHF